MEDKKDTELISDNYIWFCQIATGSILCVYWYICNEPTTFKEWMSLLGGSVICGFLVGGLITTLVLLPFRDFWYADKSNYSISKILKYIGFCFALSIAILIAIALILLYIGFGGWDRYY